MKAHLYVCAVIVFCVVFVCTKSSFGVDDPCAIFSRASQLETAGQYAQAAELYQQIVTQYPNDVLSTNGGKAAFRAKLLQCKLALQVDNLTAARQAAEAIKSLGGSASVMPGYLYDTAWEFEFAKSLDDAIAYYQQIVTQYPDDVLSKSGGWAAFRVKYLQCKRALNGGDIAAARQAADAVKSLGGTAKNMAGYFDDIGHAFENAGFLDDARAFYQQVVTQYPDDALSKNGGSAAFRAKYLQCKLALRVDNITVARQAAEAVRTLGGSEKVMPGYFYDIAYEFEVAKSFDDAIAYYQQIVTQYPDDVLSKSGGWAAFRVKYLQCKRALNGGDLAAARQAADAVRTLGGTAKNMPGYLDDIGHAFENAGFLADAIAYYQQAVTQYPDDVLVANGGSAAFRAKYLQCKLALRVGDIAAARQAADAIKSLGGSADVMPGYFYDIAYEFEVAKSFDDAISYYQQIVTQYPNDVRSKNGGWAAFRVKYLQCKRAINDGDIAVARAAADAVKSLGGSEKVMPGYLYDTGRAFELAGFLADAKVYYQQVVAQYPASPDAGRAQVAIDSFQIPPLMEAGDLDKANTLVTTLSSKCSRDDKMLMLSKGVEDFYKTGMKRSQSDPNRNEYYRKSVGLLENNMLALGLTDVENARIHYMRGIEYDLLGDYAKAAKAFETSYATDPTFMYADYCLYAQGYCYEKLLEKGTVSEIDAKTAIMAKYSQFVLKYPQSGYAPHAQLWLENNSR